MLKVRVGNGSLTIKLEICSVAHRVWNPASHFVLRLCRNFDLKLFLASSTSAKACILAARGGSPRSGIVEISRRSGKRPVDFRIDEAAKREISVGLTAERREATRMRTGCSNRPQEMVSRDRVDALLPCLRQPTEISNHSGPSVAANAVETNKARAKGWYQEWQACAVANVREFFDDDAEG